MNVMVGDNRLENAAVRPSDVKARDAHIAGNKQTQEESGEQAKRVPENGVVVELNKPGRNIPSTGKTERTDKVKTDTKEEQQENTKYLALKNEQRKIADLQRILENINI